MVTTTHFCCYKYIFIQTTKVMVVASHAWQLPLTSVKDDGDNEEDTWDWILCRRPTCSTSLHFSCLSTLSLPRSLLPDSYPPLFSYFLPPPITCHCDIIRTTAEILILKKHTSILTTKLRMLPDVFTTLRWVHLSNLPPLFTTRSSFSTKVLWCPQSLSYGPFSSLLATCLLPSQKPPIF